MRKLKRTLSILLVGVTLLIGGAALSNSSIEQQCRNKFAQSQASGACDINNFIKAEKPGQYWQCHMELYCNASTGEAWITSGWQLNLLSSLHYCEDEKDTKYGSC